MVLQILEIILVFLAEEHEILGTAEVLHDDFGVRTSCLGLLGLHRGDESRKIQFPHGFGLVALSDNVVNLRQFA